MNQGDLVGLLVMLLMMTFILVHMIRFSRRRSGEGREPSPPPAHPRRIVMPRPEPVSKRDASPPKRVESPRRRPEPPSLEARVLRNRRLSPGARMVVASEILSPPKALRRRRQGTP